MHSVHGRGESATADPVVTPDLRELDAGLVRRMWEASPLGMLLSDASGVCLYSNAACQQITGTPPEQTNGRPWHALVHPEERAQCVARWTASQRDKAPFHSEVRLVRPDHTLVWVRLHSATVPGAGTARLCILLIEDVTERKVTEGILRTAEDALFEEKERAQVTLNSIGDAVLVTDNALNVTFLNPEAMRLTGWTNETAIGKPLGDVFPLLNGDTLNPVRPPAEQAIDEDRTVGLELGSLLVRRDGSTIEIEDSAAPIHNRDGSVGGAVIVFHDAARSEATLTRNAHLARHDALTGLANIALLTERLPKAITRARRHQNCLALLYIDMDHFKGVNDMHGHLVGDELLKSVSARMQACVRGSDTVCRRGGDEFVILLEDIESREHALRAAAKVHAALCEPHVIEGIRVDSGASIGLSLFPEDGEDATSLLKRADRHMYRAKAAKPQASAVTAGRVPASPWAALRVMKALMRRKADTIAKSSGSSSR